MRVQMGWGLELWDKETEIKAYVDDGIKFLDKAKSLAFDVARLESIFGQQIKKLVRSYFPTTQDDVYSYDHAFRV